MVIKLSSLCVGGHEDEELTSALFAKRSRTPQTTWWPAKTSAAAKCGQRVELGSVPRLALIIETCSV